MSGLTCGPDSRPRQHDLDRTADVEAQSGETPVRATPNSHAHQFLRRIPGQRGTNAVGHQRHGIRGQVRVPGDPDARQQLSPVHAATSVATAIAVHEVLPSTTSAFDFAELLVDTVADPHHGQYALANCCSYPAKAPTGPRHSSAVASARMVRNEDRGRFPFSMCDR